MSSSRWHSSKVVVVGGHGFIGSHFVHQLARLGASVVVLYRTERRGPLSSLSRGTHRVESCQVDLLDSGAFAGICQPAVQGADVLICCAGLDGNADFKTRHAATILDTNLRITSNVLNCALAAGIRDVVLVSSAEVYSREAANPVSEEDDYETRLDGTGNGYVMSKIFAEVLGRAYREQYGLRVYCPRPTNVYGPGDYTGPTASRVIPSMIERALAGSDIEIWGDGNQIRSFMYVDDMVRSVLAMIRHGVEGALNVGTREQVSMLEVAGLVFRIFGGTGRISWQAAKPSGVGARVLDVSKLYSIIGFEPRPLATGLEEMARSRRK